MGKPTVSTVSADEYIVCERQTQGTETSKYLKESKSTEIPLVVASESGTAQTRGNFSLGSWGQQCGSERLVERSGKSGHSG